MEELDAELIIELPGRMELKKIVRLSYNEKMKWAEEIRKTTPLEADISEDYESYLDQVEIEEYYLDTSEGVTHIYILKAKARKEKSSLFINIHGGGFALGHFKRDLIFSAKMAVCFSGVAIDIDYKLAPEYGYPVALHECHDVVRWAFLHERELEIDNQRITVCGHSAGANLVAALTMKLMGGEEPLPALLVMDYPFLDFTVKADHGVPNAADRSRAFQTFYTDDIDEIIYSPYVSPLLAPDDMLKGMPPVLMITAKKDGLRFQGMEFAKRLKDLGTTVWDRCFEDSSHGFVIYGNGQRDKAHDLILRTIKEVIQ